MCRVIRKAVLCASVVWVVAMVTQTPGVAECSPIRLSDFDEDPEKPRVIAEQRQCAVEWLVRHLLAHRARQADWSEDGDVDPSMFSEPPRRHHPRVRRLYSRFRI
uniref:Secreted protein n=2 Tax=Macrostomum lignano TaxID=282301 RepID=A0A1I8H9K9_9PLAT